MIVLRTLAIVLAIAAFVDPEVTLNRRVPSTARVYAAPGDPDATATVATLRAALAGTVELAEAGSGQANILVGNAPVAEAARSGKPISVVSLDVFPAVALARVPAVVRVLPGTATEIPVDLDAAGAIGRTTSVVLEQDGVLLAREDHTCKNDGRATVRLPYVATSAGARRVSIRAVPLAGERRLEDNRADLLIMAADRRARVAVVETRPSWPAGFARRALESDDRFSVSSVVKVTKSAASRAGQSPPVLRAQQLSQFDVVLVGAPEDLRRDEVEVLWQFAERRGGTVVLLPDRAPAGPYAGRLPERLTEHLLSDARVLEPAHVLASELVVMSSLPPGGRAHATLESAPVIVSWPVGDGRVVFSGALDAWRYRGDPKSQLMRFWRSELLSAALTAPPAISIDLGPAVARPGSDVSVVVRLRKTGFDDRADAERTSVQAQLIDPSGARDAIRLWPSPEPGMFHGRVSSSRAGVHSIRVETPRAVAETTLLVAADANAVAHGASTGPADLAELTGGVAVSADRLQPLIDHLAGLRRPTERVDMRPFRAAWLPWIFAALLCGEWALRRKAGLR